MSTIPLNFSRQVCPRYSAPLMSVEKHMAAYTLKDIVDVLEYASEAYPPRYDFPIVSFVSERQITSRLIICLFMVKMNKNILKQFHINLREICK